MESSISARFISERILHKLKETLHAQTALPQNDLSIQMSCMRAATSTLLEVKNTLDGLSKTSLRKVADNLASTDGHFVIQRYLVKSYFFLESDGRTLADRDIIREVDQGSHPSGVLIFCPLYVAVTEVLTRLVVSQTFAGNIAATKIVHLFLKDLNVLVLPSSEPEQFKMLLSNIHFLWELSKNPASLVHFRNYCDTVLVFINVFVSYQGPNEQLRTLVKSLAIIIAAEVADEETIVYLLAEESCIDFVCDILTKAVNAGDKYLNHHGVYAVDIAKCIENLSRFEDLHESLLSKGVVELLVSMIQIGDPYDDSAAASALNKLVRTPGIVDQPVLLQGLASYCGEDLPANKKENTSKSAEQRKPNVEEKETDESLPLTSLNKNEKEADSKEEFSLEVVQQHVKEGNVMDKIENLNSVVSGSGSECRDLHGVNTLTAEVNPDRSVIVSREEKTVAASLENNDCDIPEDLVRKETGSGEVGFKYKYEASDGQNEQKEICNQDTPISNDEAEVKEAPEMPELPQKPASLKMSCTQGANQPHQTKPVKLEPDVSRETESKCKQSPAGRPFQHQETGTDHLSGQELHRIHLSLIELGVHNLYDEKLVGILNELLEETKLREDGVFDILNSVPDVYSYKMMRTGSMERQLRVAPAYNDGDINEPLHVIHLQPEIDYHLVLKKFIFYLVQDHSSKVDFPGFTLVGPWLETIPAALEEWSFCFVPQKSGKEKEQYYLSAERLKSNFLCPIWLSFMRMSIKHNSLAIGAAAVGESVKRDSLKCHGITVRKVEENGPAVTVYYFDKHLTVDYVLSLRHIKWPSCAASWPERQRQWPENYTVRDITNYGCHLVPKQPPCLSKEDPLYGMFFQYSFARAENILLNKLNGDIPVLTDCLRMLKFLCELHFDRPKLLKSYHMQTIVLWAAERVPLSHWKTNSFVKHLLDLLDDLLHHLVAHNLPNYFIPQQNLFQQFSPDFVLDVAVRVSKVRRNPIKYLTPSSDLAKFGIYVI